MKLSLLLLIPALLLAFGAQAQKNKFKAGKKAPAFDLKDSEGNSQKLDDLLKTNDNVVLLFYMGSWNKYDVEYLKAVNEKYDAFKSKNTEVLAITREKASYANQTKAQDGIQFPILMDNDWYIISQYELANKISKGYLPSKYREFSKYNATHTGSKDDVIPIPATYVIGKDGKVKWNHFDIDYRQRPAVADILNNL